MYKHKGRREYERWEDFIICKVKSLTRRRHVLIILRIISYIKLIIIAEYPTSTIDKFECTVYF